MGFSSLRLENWRIQYGGRGGGDGDEPESRKLEAGMGHRAAAKLKSYVYIATADSAGVAYPVNPCSSAANKEVKKGD